MDANALLARIDAYCQAQEISPTAFGLRTVNDGKLVFRLREGKTITLKTFARLDAVLAAGEGRRQRSKRGVAA